MRIGTYNVLGLTGYPKDEASRAIGVPGDERNSQHFARVFSELSCDVLALQEGVAARTMQNIARSMKRSLATFPSPINWPGHVLSRYPIIESRVLSHLDPEQETPPFSRTFGVAFVSVADQILAVVDVHLHPSDAALRAREAEIVVARLHDITSVTENVVVLGDFNSEVDEPVHVALKSAGFANAIETVGGGIQATMDTAGIRLHFIDHIYASPRLALYLKSAHVVRDPGFRHDGPQKPGVWVNSDHLPVVAELAWPHGE